MTASQTSLKLVRIKMGFACSYRVPAKAAAHATEWTAVALVRPVARARRMSAVPLPRGDSGAWKHLGLPSLLRVPGENCCMSRGSFFDDVEVRHPTDEVAQVLLRLGPIEVEGPSEVRPRFAVRRSPAA